MTDDGLRPPDAVVAEARSHSRDPPANPLANVVVASDVRDVDATLTDAGYEGTDAVACGHLEAALSVEDAVRLHHDDVDALDPNPWLVLAPLGGFVATVATGTATVTARVPLPDDRLSTARSRLDSVLSAVRARHDHYPVEADEASVFRTGMTTFSLAGVTVDDALTVRFAASTTPATTESAIAERFETVDFDAAVDVDFEQGVERASPSASLRAAVEDAHRAVVGDAQYEWLSRPTVFSRLPTAEKVAFGAGAGTTFSREDYERTRDLLGRTAEALEGGRET